ncbi:MAG: replicative DNA helicase [Verrucomicrobiota bacterium]
MSDEVMGMDAPPPEMPALAVEQVVDLPEAADRVFRPGLGGRRRGVDLSRIDRLPPHSLEAEQGVLGCALLEPSDAIGQCIERLKGGGEAFYDLRHRTIYDVLVSMYDRKEPIDLITLGQKLKDAGQIDGVGGLAYLSELMDAVPSAANLAYYLDIVREKHVLRRVLSTCSEAVSKVHEYEGAVDSLLDEVERDILKISQDRSENTNRTMRELVRSAVDMIQDFHQRKGGLTGLPTGFPDLDKMTSGLQPADMVVIAARPSMGKTSLAMNIAEHVSVEANLPVGVFSLEMTSESLVMRMLCSLARVNGRLIRDGFLSEGDFRRLTAAAGKLSRAPIHIDDTPGLSILQLRARARRMWQQHGVKLFIIDYLQLMHSTSKKAADSRQQEVAELSNGVKALAKELKVPVIVLCQLNRELEKDKDRKPKLSDLRESGAIEQDADLVGLLYKPAAEDDDHRREDPEARDDGMGATPVNLLIAKQRNGPTGDVCLTFLKGITRYESASKIAAAD